MKIGAEQLPKNEKETVVNLNAPVQNTYAPSSYLQDNRPQTLQRKANNTGLPDSLKSGIENLSRHSMDDVKVHYNSSQPVQLNAQAYAQGTNIHIAPGQEKHLPHEAWHVAQQKQGRVKPTMQMKGKVNINDDKGLEKEADVMGGRAIQMVENKYQGASENVLPFNDLLSNNIVQRVINAADLVHIQQIQPVANSDVVVENANQDQFRISALTAANATLDEVDSHPLIQIVAPIANLQANYTLIHAGHGGMNISPNDLNNQSAHNQVRNGSQVIDISGHPLGFAHYSYDLLNVNNNAAPNDRDNDHLTIENALSLLLLKLHAKESADDITYFLQHKPQQTKAAINLELAVNHRVPEIDNFNFRPLAANQAPRAIPNAIDPAGALVAVGAGPGRKNIASGPVQVDNNLSLQQFWTYIEASLRRMNVPNPLITQIEQSLRDEATTRMGFQLNQLFLNGDQIKDVTRFALVMRNVVGMNWLRDSLPGPLLGFAKNPPYVDINETDFQTLAGPLQAGVNAALFAQINNDITTEGYWRANSGQPGFASVSQFLTTHYWPTIRTWILNP